MPCFLSALSVLFYGLANNPKLWGSKTANISYKFSSTNLFCCLCFVCVCSFISKVKIFICNFKFSTLGIYLSKSIETTKQQSVRNVWLLLNISFLEYAVNCLDVFLFFVFLVLFCIEQT